MAELGRICQIRQKIAFEKIFPHLIEAAKQKWQALLTDQIELEFIFFSQR